VSLSKPLKTLQKWAIDWRLSYGYNTRSIQEDAYRLYPPEAEGHWRTA